MKKVLIAKLSPDRDWVKDIIENTDYMVILTNYDEMYEIGYLDRCINHNSCTTEQCSMYNKKDNLIYNAEIEYDFYDDEIRVYIKR